MLIPFKESFYGTFGYVIANSNLDVKAPLYSLIYALAPEADTEWQFERVPASSVKNEFFAFMLTVAAKQHHGINLPVNMNDEKWKLRTQKELCIFVKHNHQLVALAIYSIDANGFKPKSERAIYVYQKGISALVYGVLPLEEIEYRQWLNVLISDTRETLKRWFSSSTNL